MSQKMDAEIKRLKDEIQLCDKRKDNIPQGIIDRKAGLAEYQKVGLAEYWWYSNEAYQKTIDKAYNRQTSRLQTLQKDR